MNEPLLDNAHFWSRIDRSAGRRGCWPWLRGVEKGGYGKIQYQGRKYSAHRIAYRIHHGPVPPDLGVLHTCDNPPCCNPAHLFVGTNLDNIADKMAKGRHMCPKGEHQWCAKLSESAVVSIRKRYKWRIVTFKMLAIEHGVTASLIGRIVRGQNWKHLITGTK